jgi:hypothetical protein
MRELTHANPDATLPPRLTVAPDLSAMSRDELWDAVDSLSRVMTEATRRRLPAEVFARLDVARAMALAMYSTAPEPAA